MNRRDTIKGATALATGLTLVQSAFAAPPPRSRKNFLLVHGAWHSSLHWNRVAAILTAQGHLVQAIDLPGAGLNASYPKSYLLNDFEAFKTEVSPLRAIRLADYREAIVAQIQRMSAHGKVTMVGHSMGGLAITASAEAVPERIARLVYLTAYAPVAFKSGAEYGNLPENAGAQASNVFIGDPASTGAVRLNPRSADPAYLELAHQAFYNDVPADDFVRFAAQLVPDVPVNIVLDEARGTAARWGAVPRTYIRCTRDHAIPIALQDRMIAEADAATPRNRFDIKTLTSSHSPFASVPAELAGMLGSLA